MLRGLACKGLWARCQPKILHFFDFTAEDLLSSIVQFFVFVFLFSNIIHLSTRPYDITVLNASDFLDLLTSRAFERVVRQPEREARPYERGARASESSCRVLPHQTRKPSERLFKFGAEYI